ncbi:complex I NDUFA9 subunit family protein [Trichlorobacter ammonificans]|uniref:NAD-dependent epimerase/dehydratase n=1 Tax=Trichlorobacter ammonificans TaxID=2916410 RepID=A0ABM9DAT1_9BACT|nr:complex I NDUFA9 subunit family protein [Trichlorobacter ammonificans]CAH2032304.1 NAD-dependent epimerase/dehydratase [Trichlorobacter ammonificans]
MKIFIAGATGFVGGHLTEALRQRGHELVLLSHARRLTTEAGLSYVTGDVTEPDSYAAAMKGCDAAINLVGIIREFPGRGITFERLHVEATAAMVATAQKSGVLRYLQMSALGTRANAVSRYHQTKWRAEEIVRASGLAWTIFRPSLIFGPKDAFVNMLARQIRLLPLLPTFGDGTYRLQPIHGNDVARCFCEALEKAETRGQTYSLCGPDRLSYRELLDVIAEAVGRPHPLKPALPLGLMKPIISRLQGIAAFPITLDQLQMLLEENICDGDWQNTFTTPPVRFRDGIRAYLGR